jgi:UDP-2,3-diacylglucosamine pyrophosphatase LpxH
MRTVVISDAHLGSKESNYRELNRFLLRLDCDRLILAGDFWDLWEMEPKELREQYADTILHLRNLTKRGIQVEMLLGNHEEDYLDDPVVPLSVVPVRDSIAIRTPGGRSVAVVHGDQYDRIFTKFYWFYRALCWGNDACRKTIGVSLKTFKKKSCTSLEGHEYWDVVEDIHERVRDAYWKFGYDAVVMGHTHCPDYKKQEKGRKIEFLNAGDWKFNNTYVEIEDDLLSLKQFGEN